MRFSLAHCLIGMVVLAVLMSFGRHHPMIPFCLVGSALIGGALGQLFSGGSRNGYAAGAVLAGVWGLVVFTLTWLLLGRWFTEDQLPYVILLGMVSGIILGGFAGAKIGARTK